MSKFKFQEPCGKCGKTEYGCTACARSAAIEQCCKAVCKDCEIGVVRVFEHGQWKHGSVEGARWKCGADAIRKAVQP